MRRNLRRERVFRDRLNPLEFYDEREVKKLFRFERVHILRIAGELREELQRPTGRNRALSPLQQLCIGCMQLSLRAWINVNECTVSRVVWRVTGAL